MIRLGDIFDFKNGRSFKKTEWREKGLPIIRIQNLNREDAAFNYFDGEYDQSIEVNTNDLLFSWSGTVGSSFGPHIWMRGVGVLNQHIFKVSFKKEILSKYAYYSLLAITEEIERSVVGAVGLVHVTKERLNEFTISLPSIPEQKRIVAILDKTFADIEQVRARTEQNLKNARELFENSLQELFAKPSFDSCSVCLKDVLLERPRNGWSPPKKYHSCSGVPVLTLSSVTGFEFNGEKIKYTTAPIKKEAHYWVENNDLLITRSNTPELVGHVAVSSDIITPTIYPDLIMKLKLDPEKVLTRFIYYQLRSAKLRDIITSSAKGANPTMKKINQGVVESLPIWFSSKERQSEIVTRLDYISTRSYDLEQVYSKKLDSLSALQKSILQKAFTGELTKDLGSQEIQEAVA